MYIYYKYAPYVKNIVFYLMMMIVSIGIHLKLLENGLWNIYERYSMWNYWDIHIGLCQSGFPIWRTIPFQYIRIDMILLLWLIIWILPQSIQVQSVYKTTFPYNIIFTKDDASASDYQVNKLTRKLNIHYIACIGSLIYLLSARIDLIFSVHKLEMFSSNHGKAH